MALREIRAELEPQKALGSIRKELSNLPCQFKNDVKLYDGAIFTATILALKKVRKFFQNLYREFLSLTCTPIVLGGGHEIAFGHYGGLKRYNDSQELNKKLGIVNFDAHFDLRPYPNGGGSSGTMFRQIADQCEEDNAHYVYVPWYTKEK